MTTFARVAANKGKSVLNTLMIAVASAGVLVLSPAAFAQHQSPFGTADDAKAMLLTVVAAVKADKAKALDMFNKGEGRFLDRDLYPFCANASDGKLVALNNSDARQLLGQDIRTLKDSSGKTFGLAQFAAAQKPEGQLTEVRYMVPNSGAHTTSLLKASFTTRAGDLVCGVGYYPVTTYWILENQSG
jgi:hypothetical protein